MDTLSLSVTIRNEQTRTEESKAITGTLSGNFVQFDLDFICAEGEYFTFKLKDGDNILYYGMIFCTDQTDPDKYMINNGQYVQTNSNNEYAFLDE